MLITKSEDVTKQGFYTILPEENSVLGRVSYYILLEFLWEGVGWGGRLFEAGRLLTFSAFRVGAYSRWALIRGWALIRINTVCMISQTQSSLEAWNLMWMIRRFFCPSRLRMLTSLWREALKASAVLPSSAAQINC